MATTILRDDFTGSGTLEGHAANGRARFTAIVLSAKPVKLQIPGVDVLASVQAITSVSQLYDIRLDVIENVGTEFCFYLDDDDDLPPDYLSVLEECASHSLPLTYTDELIRYQGAENVRQSAEYDATIHANTPMFVHHLAVMRTADAVLAAKRLPRGALSVEQPLYYELAKGGAAYVPRIGYIWNRKPTGISHWPQMLGAQVRAMHLCLGGRT